MHWTGINLSVTKTQSIHVYVVTYRSFGRTHCSTLGGCQVIIKFMKIVYMVSICSKHLLFSWKRSCFALRISSGLAGHLIRSFLRAQRALMTPHTTRQQVDVNTPSSLRTTFKNAPDASRWSAKTTCRSAGTAREQRVGRSRRCKRRRVICITTSGPKRRYEYVSSSVQAKSGFWRSLRGLSTRTLCGRRRCNILFASILASEWSWVNLLLTQSHSGSLRISDPTGQGQS